jgi:hypothetical protein
MRSFNVLRSLNDRHVYSRIFGQADLRAAFGIRPDRLHRHTMGQHTMVTNLVHLCIRQLQTRGKLPVFVTQIGEADEFIGGEKVADAIG